VIRALLALTRMHENGRYVKLAENGAGRPAPAQKVASRIPSAISESTNAATQRR
jgi:hypothetical protein